MKTTINLYKLSLSIALVGAVACSSAWAYEKPQVSDDEGLTIIQQNKKYGFIDKTGKMVIPAKHGDVKFFSEGLAGVRQNGQ